MFLMALENLEAGLEQTLQLWVLRRWNQRAFERAVHRVVIVDFVLGVLFVEGGAFHAFELRPLGVGVLLQALAGVVVFRRDAKLLAERQGLLVDRLMVTH